MTPTLRDAMAAARINRMKGRMARAWAQRQREAEPSEHPVCPAPPVNLRVRESLTTSTPDHHQRPRRAIPMDTFIQPKITGYRQLNETEAALMNEVKAHAEQTRELVNRVQHYIEDQAQQPLPEGHAPHSQVTHPARWAALAQTDLQTGYMKLIRAIAQPTTF